VGGQAWKWERRRYLRWSVLLFQWRILCQGEDGTRAEKSEMGPCFFLRTLISMFRSPEFFMEKMTNCYKTLNKRV
jgi:hypothetical protein